MENFSTSEEYNEDSHGESAKPKQRVDSGSSHVANLRRFAGKNFLKETSSEERAALAQNLSTAILFFLEVGRPVYLEGFGIITYNKTNLWANYDLDDRIVVRQESVRLPRFEKCSELVAYQRQRYEQIVETSELAQRIYPQLAFALQLKWSEVDLRHLLRGLSLHIAREVVVSGTSKALTSLGTFYALHNRQGASFSDWFAGADIFLKPNHRAVVKIGSARVHDRPVLEHPWEGLQVAFGKPLQVLKFDLIDELKSLGIQSPSFDPEVKAQLEQVRIGVFEFTSPNAERVFVYCSDGIRRLSQEQDGQQIGYEFCVQLASNSNDRSPGLEDVPLWPKRLISLAWLLLESCKSKRLKDGAGLSAGISPAGDLDPHLRTILITRFGFSPGEQVMADERFLFRNIIMLREEEAEVARLYGADHLLALLEHRKLSQMVRLRRPSLINRSGLSSPGAEIN